MQEFNPLPSLKKFARVQKFNKNINKTKLTKIIQKITAKKISNPSSCEHKPKNLTNVLKKLSIHFNPADICEKKETRKKN